MQDRKRCPIASPVGSVEHLDIQNGGVSNALERGSTLTSTPNSQQDPLKTLDLLQQALNSHDEDQTKAIDKVKKDLSTEFRKQYEAEIK